MRLSEVLGVRKIVARNSIITIGLMISAFLSVAIGVVTFYGQHAGNFVMTLDKKSFERGIVLSTSDEFLAPTPRLVANPVEDVKDVTYSWLKLDSVSKTNGDFYDPDYKYVAYTFYLKNNGTETVDVGYTIKITDLYRNIDEAIRVLLIEDDTVVKMYQKPDNIVHNYPNDMPEGIHFINNDTICNEIIENFRPNQIKKYSIIIWLEGEDPDCVDEIRGGMIKLNMKFTIAGEKAK